MKRSFIRLGVFILTVSMLLTFFACKTEEDGAANTSGEEITSGGESEKNETSVQSESESEFEFESESESESGSLTQGESQSDGKLDGESEISETVESANNEEASETEAYSETDMKSESEDTTEKDEESDIMENVYGYDFTDNSWTSLFDVAGSATRALANDPVASGEAVLSISHGAGQTASYIRNKNAFDIDGKSKAIIGVDLYIPSEALAAADAYVQMQINGEYNHHVNLVSDACTNENAFTTKDFPRDKWFTVRFVFDLTRYRYDLEIVEDGEVRAVIFTGRAASDVKTNGLLNLRVFLSGADQTVYVDHFGLVTQKAGESGDKVEIEKGVSFIRIDGVNAAGHTLSLYGDFSGGANADDLTDLKWERSDSYNGTYTTIPDALFTDYKPKDGGYYLRVSAKYGKKALKSYPVYIRESADMGFFAPYLSFDGSEISAAVVYNNEGAALEAEAKIAILDGSTVIKTFTESFTVKNGSDLAAFSFSCDGLSGKNVQLTVTVGNDTVCSTFSAEGLPLAKVKKTDEGSSVYIGKEMIADFEKNRYMRFRATVENDHWIGTQHNPIDMGFAYQESAVAGLSNTSVEFAAVPGAFKIVFSGQKVGLKTEQRNELIGFWNADTEEFSFIYNTEMTADSASWHKSSSWAPSGRIEPFDYHLERMSILDRVYNNNQNGDLYDYVIYENGDELVRIPKLPVPRTAINGKYFYGFFLSPGEWVYYPDAKDGGWKSTVLSDRGDTYVEICWSWYDIHSCSENSVPKLGNCDKFTVSQSWLFATTTAEHDSALIDKAVEVEWKDLPNYQLPLFSTNNTFETQFGGTDWQYAWWKSSYDCTMDAEVGHDGAGSVKIEKNTSGEASWYTEGVWGFPYSFDKVQGKTYRISGYIKTENVVGEAYICNIQYQHATPDDNTVTRSEALTGTSDWTYVSFTFTAQEREQANGNIQRCIDHFFLTLNGSGTVWFDDVRIEEVN